MPPPNPTLDRAFEIAERIDGAVPEVTVTRMFSGAGLSANGVTFVLVLRGSIYLRVDDKSRPAMEEMGAEPFRYDRSSGRTITVASYYEAPDDILDDQDELRRWAADAYRAALASPTKKKRKKAQKT